MTRRIPLSLPQQAGVRHTTPSFVTMAAYSRRGAAHRSNELSLLLLGRCWRDARCISRLLLPRIPLPRSSMNSRLHCCLTGYSSKFVGPEFDYVRTCSKIGRAHV